MLSLEEHVWVRPDGQDLNGPAGSRLWLCCFRRSCRKRWLLFEEWSFAVVLKHGQMNKAPVFTMCPSEIPTHPLQRLVRTCMQLPNTIDTPNPHSLRQIAFIYTLLNTTARKWVVRSVCGQLRVWCPHHRGGRPLGRLAPPHPERLRCR